MTAPTKTPRTDALTNELHDDAVESGEDYRSDARRLIAHARILENELAIARTDIEHLKTVCANYRKEAEIAVAEADELARRVGTAEARAKAFMGNLPIYDAALAAAGAIATALRKQGLRICDCGSAPQGICCCGSSSVRAEIEKERGNG